MKQSGIYPHGALLIATYLIHVNYNYYAKSSIYIILVFIFFSGRDNVKTLS